MSSDGTLNSVRSRSVMCWWSHYEVRSAGSPALSRSNSGQVVYTQRCSVSHVPLITKQFNTMPVDGQRSRLAGRHWLAAQSPVTDRQIWTVKAPRPYCWVWDTPWHRSASSSRAVSQSWHAASHILGWGRQRTNLEGTCPPVSPAHLATCMSQSVGGICKSKVRERSEVRTPEIF